MLLKTIIPLMFSQVFAADPIILNTQDSQNLFNVLSKWKTTVTDSSTNAKNISVSAVICSESLEDRRQLGCSLYDELHNRDVTKKNKLAQPLYTALSKHISPECDDDGDDVGDSEDSNMCTLSIDKIECQQAENIFACTLL